ncbi:MAG: hypothetical protein QNL04_04840 [SAR324 cluster bacterium]|nr:hypothetical protein [SAR324 cluster bacterium]
MTEINKINPAGLLKPIAKTQKTEATSGDFEAKLQQTVQKLENMGSEIDAMLAGTAKGGASEITQGVNQLGNMIQSVKGMVENISPSQKSSSGSAKYAASQYEKMNKNSES